MMTTNKLQLQMKHFEKILGGTIGVSAMHLSTGQEFHYNSQHTFLLCSTYKVPIVTCLLQKVERNELSLNQIIEIHEYDICPGIASTLTHLDYSSPIQFSILNLIQFMLQESCNTASDIILNLVGGPSAVNEALANVGISDVHIRRSCFESIAIWDGLIDKIPKGHKVTLKEYAHLEKQVDPAILRTIHGNFDIKQDDHGTPAAICELLNQIATHSIINQKHAELIFKIMRRCKTSAKRLMGLLPPKTMVSHKTGTLGKHINDIGVIYPGTELNEKILIAVYTKDCHSPEAGERAIAETARTIYDYFILNKCN